MQSDDELGTVLAGRLQTLVRDIEPSDAFIDRLDRAISRSRSPRRSGLSTRMYRRIAALSIPSGAVIAAAIVLLVGSNPAPSFAVTLNSDGSVLVTIRNIEGVAGANRRLRALGVTNVVIVPMTAGCATRVELSYTGVGIQRPTTIRLRPTEIAAGSTVLLAAQPISANKVDLAFGRVTGPPPSCVAPGQIGPGISSSFPHTSSGPTNTQSTPGG